MEERRRCTAAEAVYLSGKRTEHEIRCARQGIHKLRQAAGVPYMCLLFLSQTVGLAFFISLESHAVFPMK